MSTDKRKRRLLLATLATGALQVGSGLMPHAARANAASVLTVLYRPDEDGQPQRGETTPVAATAQLEKAFSDAGFNVRNPSAKDLELMDQGPAMVINFDAGAGACLTFSVVQSLRPRPGDMTAVEVQIRARVHLGPSVLVTVTGDTAVGKRMATVAGADGERLALLQAAQIAAQQVAQQVVPRLRALTAADLAASVRPLPSVTAGGLVVPVPRPARPPAGPSGDANQPLPAPARRHALLVGVSDYSRVNQANAGKLKVSNLPGVAVDLKLLEAALRARGFAGSDIVVLENANATSANVRAQLMALAAKVQPTDLVLVAFSAHGAPSAYTPSGYGLAVLDDFKLNGKGDHNAIDFWQVQGLIGHLPARQAVLVVDTCHAGGVAIRMPRLTLQAGGASTLSQGTVAPEPAKVTADVVDASKHYAVLAASQPEEVSLEDQPHGGLFTSRLVRGIESASGQKPLAQIFSERVEREVIDRSTEICRRRPDCKVQTPVFAYAGRGNLIRL